MDDAHSALSFHHSTFHRKETIPLHQLQIRNIQRGWGSSYRKQAPASSSAHMVPLPCMLTCTGGWGITGGLQQVRGRVRGIFSVERASDSCERRAMVDRETGMGGWGNPTAWWRWWIRMLPWRGWYRRRLMDAIGKLSALYRQQRKRFYRRTVQYKGCWCDKLRPVQFWCHGRVLK